MQRVALLGLGAMGSGMAANWLKRGFPLTVYNRSRKKADALEAAGAGFAPTPREAAAEADVILSIVSDDLASRDVWLGDRGALAGAKRGAVAIESSTVSPHWTLELGRAAEGGGLRFLDAPVGGSKPAAKAGTLFFFVGGEPVALEAARPALEAVSAMITHLGGVGSGTTWKLINNWLIAAQVAALAEAVNFAVKAGFKSDQIASLVLASSSASPIVQAKLPRILERRFADAEFALGLMYKDTRYALDLAQDSGVPLDMLRGAVAAFGRAEARGLASLDFAAVAAGAPLAPRSAYRR